MIKFKLKTTQRYHFHYVFKNSWQDQQNGLPYLDHLQTVLCPHSWIQSSMECRSCTEGSSPAAWFGKLSKEGKTQLWGKIIRHANGVEVGRHRYNEWTYKYCSMAWIWLKSTCCTVHGFAKNHELKKQNSINIRVIRWDMVV